MIKLIIFDWDDVFTLGAKEGYFACYHEALTSVGAHLPAEVEKQRILDTWSKPYPIQLSELLKEHPDLVEKACRSWESSYWGDVFVNSLREVAGANELLVRLKQTYTLAIATGNFPKMLKERIFPHFHIPDVFAQIVSSWDNPDTAKSKPHPYMLETIMDRQQVSPDETIYVGDAKTDVEMAQNARVTPVVVLSGNLNREEALALDVSYIIDDVTSVETILPTIQNLPL